MSGPVARRIVANLDCEASYARATLPRKVLVTLSAYGTLLRALAEPGERLWTPLPVDPRRLAPARGLAAPELESGPLERLPRASETVRWGRLDTAAAAANHRGFCLAAAEAMGHALPGARMVESIAELESHLRSGGASAAPAAEWVVKSPWSAAGRDRIRGHGPEVPDAVRSRVERLLRARGPLLFEPWMDRTEDFGGCALISGAEITELPPHRQIVDADGSFRGILVDPRGHDALEEEEADELRRVARAVGDRLRAMGYDGPFGVDCWRYRVPGGRVRFHPLGEVNVRMSFGFVARALADRLRASGAIPGEGPVLLELGRGTGLERVRGALAAGQTLVPLLVAGEDGDEAAWIVAGGGTAARTSSRTAAPMRISR